VILELAGLIIGASVLSESMPDPLTLDCVLEFCQVTDKHTVESLFEDIGTLCGLRFTFLSDVRSEKIEENPTAYKITFVEIQMDRSNFSIPIQCHIAQSKIFSWLKDLASEHVHRLHVLRIRNPGGKTLDQLDPEELARKEQFSAILQDWEKAYETQNLRLWLLRLLSRS
jgi:hypothetical protein